MARKRKAPVTRVRQKNVPNYIKTDSGTLINKEGVEFTPDEKRLLENAVNRANRKRKKMLEFQATLPRLHSGIDTGDTASSLNSFGKESDFILTRKTKSLHRFKSHEEYERYMKNLDLVNRTDYIDIRTKAYKRNYMTALDHAFGDDAKDVKMKVRMMKPDDFRKLAMSDENLEIWYAYFEVEGKERLNKIRMALGMKLKEI